MQICFVSPNLHPYPLQRKLKSQGDEPSLSAEQTLKVQMGVEENVLPGDAGKAITVSTWKKGLIHPL